VESAAMADYTVELIPTSDFIEELILDEPVIELVSASNFVEELTQDEPNVELIAPGDFMDEIPFGAGGSEQTVVNRVWDTVAGNFVRWMTNAIDSAGTFYPGPGTFGVHTSDYVVETINYTSV